MKFSLARNISFRFQKALFTVLFLILHSGVFPQSTTEQPDSTSGSKVIVEEPYPGTGDEEEQIEYFGLKNSTSQPDSFSKQQLPDSVIKAMQQDEDFWYANYVF